MKPSRKLLTGLSLLMLFIPATASAHHSEPHGAKRVPYYETDQKLGCVTADVKGKIIKGCVNTPEGWIINDELFIICEEIGADRGQISCFITSDGGYPVIIVESGSYGGTLPK